MLCMRCPSYLWYYMVVCFCFFPSQNILRICNGQRMFAFRTSVMMRRSWRWRPGGMARLIYFKTFLVLIVLFLSAFEEMAMRLILFFPSFFATIRTQSRKTNVLKISAILDNNKLGVFFREIYSYFSNNSNKFNISIFFKKYMYIKHSIPPSSLSFTNIHEWWFLNEWSSFETWVNIYAAAAA